MSKSHDDRCVLVTGAGRGIGRAIALAFADAGARVGALDQDADSAAETAALAESRGTAAVAVGADVSDYPRMEDALAKVVDTLGPVDILINNAGISPKQDGVRVPFTELDPAEWTEVVAVNLTGCFNAARIVAPGMVERRRGAIVNMSSVAGKAYLDVIGAHYSATKAALIGFTRHLAGELGPHGITVNAIAPGRIDSPMGRMVGPEVNEAIRRATPLGRFGEGADVANVALFLTAPETGFVTGQTIDVAGGWMMT
ncbi:MAG: SDR family NAD(P)-dependent oxidoreductase [Alphaproteobacteria bacterium]|jgi:3-oxoacyl-[acyl-carrier protein] reductase|nr:SDR family NAD(P)-dependent oxidoreductase [Alphaproteobacteria bacterium]MDP6516027.1 SDR family NAD(P)-dependent oxidoreductase [Alphaproteobacteria bacterium]